MKNPYLQIITRLLAYAGLWAVGGYMAGAALETIGLSSHPLSVGCASLNVLVGLMLFKIITDDPTFEQIFFGQKHVPRYHIGYKIVRSLWVLPIILLFAGLLMWFWAIVINLLMQD